MSRPLPDVDDPEFAPFWSGTSAGELRLVFCARCDEVRWPPRPVCPRCRSFELEWRAVDPRGHLHTWTVVEHQTTADMPPPYVVGLVQIADHPTVRLIGQIDAGAASLVIDLPLTTRFDQVDERVTLVNWVPSEVRS